MKHSVRLLRNLVEWREGKVAPNWKVAGKHLPKVPERIPIDQAIPVELGVVVSCLETLSGCQYFNRLFCLIPPAS